MTNDKILNIIASGTDMAVEDFSNIVYTLDGGFCEVAFNTEYMSYRCYVNTATGELDGFIFEPIALADVLSDTYTA